MENKNIYEQINKAFSDFCQNSEKYRLNIGKPINLLEIEVGELITQVIPDILYQIFDPNIYKIKGSIGKGLLTKSPWIAVMKKNITTSTQKGVYLLFIFNTDLNGIYIGLSQSVTSGYYLGTKKNKRELAFKRDKIRHSLNLDSSYFNYNLDDIHIANKLYKESLIYAYPWDYNSTDSKESLLESFSSAYVNYYLQVYH